MDVYFVLCKVLQIANAQLQNRSVAISQLSVCCAKVKIWFGPAPESPCVLRSLLAETRSTEPRFSQNLRAYITGLSMACVKVTWVAEGPDPSTFNPTITMRERIYYYIGTVLPETEREPAF